jgi:hypothetical protein
MKWMFLQLVVPDTLDYSHSMFARQVQKVKCFLGGFNSRILRQEVTSFCPT